MTTGKVYLVGAGPGDPKLLTVRASELIKVADVVIYDRLISPRVLNLVPKNAEKVYVGKIPHCKGGISQAEINLMMIKHARTGKRVVRLKGGDPLLFSRGGEEAEALRAAKVEFEIVPGVTSAFAGPAFAGIPLTHRAYSSSVAIVTGHEDPSKISSGVDWAKLASSVDTIVVLMGVGRIKQIAQELIGGGLESSTPVAVIESATMDTQRTLLFTLEQAARGLLEITIGSPGVMVIGEVAALARTLRWNSSTLLDYVSMVVPAPAQIVS